MAEAKPIAKKKRARSPGYPGVDLRQALELTGTVYEQARHHPIATEAVFQAWGLKPKTGQSVTTIAALKKFGLLEPLGSGKVKVTDLALNILLDEREDSQEKAELIRQAALTPRIHDELWNQYGGDLPGNQALKFYLLRDRQFTDSGADDFIREFRKTIAFAGLSYGDVQSGEEGDKIEPAEEAHMAPSHNPGQIHPDHRKQHSPGLREVPIPIPGSAWPILKAGFPLTEVEWNQMLEVLAVMKPGLVEPKLDS